MSETLTSYRLTTWRHNSRQEPLWVFYSPQNPSTRNDFNSFHPEDGGNMEL